MRYRKRPIEIDAWQWLFSGEQTEPPAWVSDALFKWPAIGSLAFEPGHQHGPRICIATLDAIAIAIATPGDWICRGIKGELYPCKPDIFDELYEPVREVAESPL